MRIILIVSLCLAFLSVGAFSASTPVSYEYKFVYQCDEKKANSAASEGWELVNLSMASYGSLGVGTCAFKRAK